VIREKLFWSCRAGESNGISYCWSHAEREGEKWGGRRDLRVSIRSSEKVEA